MKRPSGGESKGEELSRLAKRLTQQEGASETSLRKAVRAILFALLLLVSWSATLIFCPFPDRVAVIMGEPSLRDIKAPRQVTYISEVKTQEARLAAAAKVKDAYSAPDMESASKQIRALQNIADYITAIRSDLFTDPAQKLELLREIPGLELSNSSLTKVLELGEDEWQGVVAETLRVLDQVMREEIRSNQVIEARQRVQRTMTRALSAEQQAVVIGLSQSMLVANSFFDAKQTMADREAATSTIEALPWTIREGESLLREGEIVSDLALEKLKVLGLLDSGRQWQDSLGMILFSLVIVVVLSLYVARSQPLLLARPRRELLLVLTLIVVGVVARLAIPGHTLIPYLFPAAAVTMSIAILFDVQLAMVISAVVAITVGYNAGGSIELVVYALVGGMVGGLAIWRMDHISSFIRATVYIALTNVAVILAFRLNGHSHYDIVGLVQLLVMGLFNAIISASLALVAFSLIGRLFGITTSLQLLELAHPTHPLFRQLLIKAPGTYHHSLIVSNMSERAAEAIGADGLLARVGSYYHDVGKIARPYFFAENQTDGENPHDRLDPKTSAEIIIAHATEGYELASRYRLPDKVRDFIREHHGRCLVTYFYRRANQDGNGEANEDDFRYPGPKPQSRETAIVMLADSIEAWVRANRPSAQLEMERVIRRVINDRLVSGQLDECDLTLRDLDKIREAFVSVLQGVFHPRIQYPDRAPRRTAPEPLPQHTEVEKAT